jgi:phosphoribosylformylglycinamidine synthase
LNVAKPRVLVLRAAGTNCDAETAFAFEQAGAEASLVHVNRLAEGSARLSGFQMLAIPGGFSYGDDVAAGKILALELEHRLGSELASFVSRGGLVIGICNGFQVLVRTGLLPGNDGFSPGEAVTLASNDSQKYEDRWVRLEVLDTSCVWLRPSEDMLALPWIELPVAHAEGKFVPASSAVMETLKENRQVVLRYVGPDGGEAAYPANPNGSVEGVAGITDATGRVFGLMPHPERHVFRRQHPRWTRGEGSSPPDGRQVFANAVRTLS